MQSFYLYIQSLRGKPFLRRRKARIVLTVVALLLWSDWWGHAERMSVRSTAQPTGSISVSLQHEVHAAVARGLDWLAQEQKPNGSWSDSSFPALTALALRPFIYGSHPEKDRIISRGVDFLLSCRQPDGGIYRKKERRQGGGLSGYNTAISMMTLHALDQPRLTSVILDARDFVSRTEHFGLSVQCGEFAYNRDTQRAYTDLLNTYYIAEAMRFTESAEADRSPGRPAADIDWKMIIEKISRKGESSAGSPDTGPLLYTPGQMKTTNSDDRIVFRSYGSMTYAGLMSLLYAKAGADDPRVRSALDWAARHWTLSENPGMGQQGLYFFYHILARALTASGFDLIAREDGSFINWREELAMRLVSLQKVEPKTGHGYWTNPEARFWEDDPILVTAYALQVLQSL